MKKNDRVKIRHFPEKTNAFYKDLLICKTGKIINLYNAKGTEEVIELVDNRVNDNNIVYVRLDNGKLVGGNKSWWTYE